MRFLKIIINSPVVPPVERQGDGRDEQPLPFVLAPPHRVLDLVRLLRLVVKAAARRRTSTVSIDDVAAASAAAAATLVPPLAQHLLRRDQSRGRPPGEPAVHRRHQRGPECLGVPERTERCEVGPDDRDDERDVGVGGGQQRVVAREVDARRAVGDGAGDLRVRERPGARDVDVEGREGVDGEGVSLGDLGGGRSHGEEGRGSDGDRGERRQKGASSRERKRIRRRI